MIPIDFCSVKKSVTRLGMNSGRAVRQQEKEPVVFLCGLQVEPAPETGHYIDRKKK